MLNQYLQFFLIFKWIDIAEVLIFSTIFYFFSIWLQNDKQKNLLPTFYLMNIVLIFTNIACMDTIFNFLLHFSPVFIMLFILVHQNTLQKNFITIKNLSPNKNKDENWFEEFMRSCLIAMNNKKEIITVIEGHDSFEYFINTNFTIKTAVNQELSNALINSPSFESKKMLWLSWDGIFKGINATWNIENDLLWTQEKDQNIDKWKLDAILFSSKMDCLIFKTNIIARTFDIVVHGKIMENIAPNNAINIIDQFIKKINLKKENNEIKTSSKKYNDKQPSA